MPNKGNPAYQILVVDDEPSVCRAIKMMLNFDGHTVQTAGSGEAGLAAFEQGSFDLVITDYSMQEMKGDQMAALIRERRPGQRILMATAFADDLTAFGKVTKSVDFILNKPFSLQDMREAIARVMA